MCGLCSHDPKEKQNAQEHLSRVVRDLKRMAELQTAYITGFAKPHHDDRFTTEVHALAHSLIRELVEEWM